MKAIYRLVEDEPEEPSTWDVHEGRPSWHQQRAGHISAAVTSGFENKAKAEEFARVLKEYHPDMLVFVLERKGE